MPEARQLDVLAGLLERRGASVLRCPLVGINDAPDAKPVVAWIERLIELPTDLVVFYTGEGIERLLAARAQRGARDRVRRGARAHAEADARPEAQTRAAPGSRSTPEHVATEPTTAGLVASRRGDRPSASSRVAIQLYSEDQDRRLIEHFEHRGLSPTASRRTCTRPRPMTTASPI